MTTGPDGALWFTQPLVSRIGRLATDGVYSSFAAPDLPQADQWGITTGPDGALWFVQTQGIGRITTSGSVKSYPLPNAVKPSRIVSGPDGALWFIETNRPAVGRITTAGEVNEFALPGDQIPKGIVAGPDGALWVAAVNLERVTTAGEVKAYPVADFPQNYAQAEVPTGGVVVGGDQAIWFTTEYALHRMTVDGHDTIENGFPASMGTQLNAPQTDLAVDRNGDFWISTIATGASGGGVEQVAGQSPQDRTAAKGYPNDVPASIAPGPDGAVWVGTNPSAYRAPNYGPSTILRLTADGTTVVKVLPCPS